MLEDAEKASEGGNKLDRHRHIAGGPEYWANWLLEEGRQCRQSGKEEIEVSLEK
jgi:hypothetical protein